MKRFFICLMLLLGVATVVQAQDYDYYTMAGMKSPGMTIEWGVQGGAGIWDYQVNGKTVDGRLGWQVGGTFALNWGLVAFQPELHFVHHSVALAPAPADPTKDLLLKSNSIEVPLLCSVRPLNWLRLFAGPVVTAFNKCKFESATTDMDFGRVRSTIGYTAGAGFTFGSGFLVDLRYNGVFNRQTIIGPAGNEFRVQGYAVWISLGYVFK